MSSPILSQFDVLNPILLFQSQKHAHLAIHLSNYFHLGDLVEEAGVSGVQTPETPAGPDTPVFTRRRLRSEAVSNPYLRGRGGGNGQLFPSHPRLHTSKPAASSSTSPPGSHPRPRNPPCHRPLPPPPPLGHFPIAGAPWIRVSPLSLFL